MRLIAPTIAAGLLLAGLATSAAAQQPAPGGLKKRILVYLDVSGSMDPRGRTADSPFRRTTEALSLFLEQRDLFQPQDEITLFTFGQEITGQRTWKGGTTAASEVAVFQSAVESWTDFGSVFENLRTQLKESGFDRQIVIIASDFLYEPAKGDAEAHRRAWVKTMGEAEGFLRGTVGSQKQLPVLLFVAPAKTKVPEALRLRQQVRSRIEEVTGAQVFDIGQGGMDPEALARAIRRQLLKPLELAAWFDRRGNRLRVEVKNPNGARVDLARLTIECLVPGQSYDPVPLDLENKIRTLEPGGKDRAGATLEFSPTEVSRVECLERANTYRLQVETTEGLITSFERPAGAWIQIKSPAQVSGAGNSATASAFVEGNLLSGSGLSGSALRVTAQLRGQGTRFGMQIKDGDRIVARGEFDAPSSLDAFTWREYLFTFQIPRSLGGNLATVNVEVDAEVAERVEVREDASASRTNWLQSWVAMPAFFFSLGWQILRRRRLNPGPANDFAALVVNCLSLLVILQNLLRVFLLERLTLSLNEWLQFLGLLFLFPAIAYLISFALLRNRYLRLAQEPDPTKIDPAALEKQAQSGHIAWFVALGTLVLVFFLLWNNQSDSIATAAEPVVVH